MHCVDWGKLESPVKELIVNGSLDLPDNTYFDSLFLLVGKKVRSLFKGSTTVTEIVLHISLKIHYLEKSAFVAS